MQFLLGEGGETHLEVLAEANRDDVVVGLVAIAREVVDKELSIPEVAHEGDPPVHDSATYSPLL